MGLDYAHEKLLGAAYALAAGPGRIQERLYSAWMGFHPLRAAEDFPEDLRADYQSVDDALTKPKSGDKTPRAQQEGTAKVACEELTDQEGREVAEKIVGLYYDVDRRLREPQK